MLRGEDFPHRWECEVCRVTDPRSLTCKQKVETHGEINISKIDDEFIGVLKGLEIECCDRCPIRHNCNGARSGNPTNDRFIFLEEYCQDQGESWEDTVEPLTCAEAIQYILQNTKTDIKDKFEAVYTAYIL